MSSKDSLNVLSELSNISSACFSTFSTRESAVPVTSLNVLSELSNISSACFFRFLTSWSEVSSRDFKPSDANSDTLCFLITAAVTVPTKARAASPPIIAAVFLLFLPDSLALFCTCCGFVVPEFVLLKFVFKLENKLACLTNILMPFLLYVLIKTCK